MPFKRDYKRGDIRESVQDFFKVFSEKDFSVKIPPKTKYEIACYLFGQNQADTETYAYFKKSLLKILKFAIDKRDTETVNNVIKEGSLITDKNIDKLIDYAEEKGRTEFSDILKKHKEQLEFQNKPKNK
ncbi:MAG: hypothetical protein IJ666_07975 [Ruminococcus sp.]|nr:hypothetical protein [Ruminococcus sp.]